MVHCPNTPVMAVLLVVAIRIATVSLTATVTLWIASKQPILVVLAEMVHVSVVGFPFCIKVNVMSPELLADETVADRLFKVPATVTVCVQAEILVFGVHGPTTEL
jgi:hypothetical protein